MRMSENELRITSSNEEIIGPHYLITVEFSEAITSEKFYMADEMAIEYIKEILRKRFGELVDLKIEYFDWTYSPFSLKLTYKIYKR